MWPSNVPSSLVKQSEKVSRARSRGRREGEEERKKKRKKKCAKGRGDNEIAIATRRRRVSSGNSMHKRRVRASVYAFSRGVDNEGETEHLLRDTFEEEIILYFRETFS